MTHLSGISHRSLTLMVHGVPSVFLEDVTNASITSQIDMSECQAAAKRLYKRHGDISNPTWREVKLKNTDCVCACAEDKQQFSITKHSLHMFPSTDNMCSYLHVYGSMGLAQLCNSRLFLPTFELGRSERL